VFITVPRVQARKLLSRRKKERVEPFYINTTAQLIDPERRVGRF